MRLCKESAKNWGLFAVFRMEKIVSLFSRVLYYPFSPVFLFFRGGYDTLLYYNGFFPTWLVVWKKYYCTMVVNRASLRLLFLLTEWPLMPCFLINIFSKSRPLLAILLLSLFYKQQFLRSLQKAAWKKWM